MEKDYIKEKFSEIIPEERLFSDYLRRLSYGTDAGFYRLIPKLVIDAENQEEISALLSYCNLEKIPVTFRAAGTSLSGQSVTDSVLVRIFKGWKNYLVLEGGERIFLEPGVIGGYANLYLRNLGKKLGPDPASINSAFIGGIAANNASGMTSGVKNNIYNTLEHLQIVFSDGTFLDTSDDNSIESFIEIKSELYFGIKDLAAKVKSNAILRDRISHKYKIKNTTGYGLNSLIDFDDPIQIIKHLMIGSEGTLGFIAGITLRTVPDKKFKATSLILFQDIYTAGKAIPIFQEMPVDAAEIMDRAALSSVQNKPGMPEYIKDLPNSTAALLIETSADNLDELKNNMKNISESVEFLPKVYPVEFTFDPKEYKKLWDIRKGLFPSVCGSRPLGTSVIIEDVNFPVERLADAITDLRTLFSKFGYDDTIIWGHALAGNIHFVFSPNFNKTEEVEKYDSFMKEVAILVIDKYDGSLKAEHGTGRNMAPFVKYEWGDEAYDIMKQIKKLFDPNNILNPGVILNDDEKIHIKNLKPLPEANPLIDKCIECGFCEVSCPSKELTLTPRQRITVYREIKKLEKTSDPLLKSLKKEFDYFGNQTCATDGLCAISCPVEINTGNLIKNLRFEQRSYLGNVTANLIESNFAFVTNAAKTGLNILDKVTNTIGKENFKAVSKTINKISGGLLPEWIESTPKGTVNQVAHREIESEEKVVYFPSCISRSMGVYSDSEEKRTQIDVTEILLKRAGYKIIYPTNMNKLCCGMPFSSKGFKEQGARKSDELIDELLKSSENGKIPILFDTSPCAYHLKEHLVNYHPEHLLTIYEPIEFTMKFIVNKLEFNKLEKQVIIHTTCSSVKMGLTQMFADLAEKCASIVVIPDDVGCCGFAGDRGFMYPELNKSALKNLEKWTLGENLEGYSNSRTCEIGLTENSGVEYRSILYLVEEATR